MRFPVRWPHRFPPRVPANDFSMKKNSLPPPSEVAHAILDGPPNPASNARRRRRHRIVAIRPPRFDLPSPPYKRTRPCRNYSTGRRKRCADGVALHEVINRRRRQLKTTRLNPLPNVVQMPLISVPTEATQGSARTISDGLRRGTSHRPARRDFQSYQDRRQPNPPLIDQPPWSNPSEVAMCVDRLAFQNGGPRRRRADRTALLQHRARSCSPVLIPHPAVCSSITPSDTRYRARHCPLTGSAPWDGRFRGEPGIVHGRGCS